MNSPTDLQKIPCYDSTYCDYVYNCGGTTHPFSCDPNNAPINSPIDNIPDNIPPDTCPSGLKEGYCFGSDPNYCSGIYQTCDPNLGLKCQIGNNPAKNYYGENLGCDVEKDSPCLEFESYQPCQDICWKLGGSSEVENVCSNIFNDEKSCNAMKYFCKWNSLTNKCGTLNKDTDPWTVFKNKGPKDSIGNPSKASTETINNTWTLNCAQSSWSSTDIDSYADTIRTCCLDKNDGSAKKCVTTPRCQFVDSNSDCGFKDINFDGNPTYQKTPSDPKYPWFVCDETQTTVTTSSGTKIKKGYCTWCKGTMIKDFDYRMWLINNGRIAPGFDIRDSIAWQSTPDYKNRCSSYNFCEIGDSEALWNKCIWEKSNGSHGVDPNGDINGNTDFSKGFCYGYQDVNDCINTANGDDYKIKLCNDMERYKNVCESELQPTISTKNELAAIKINTNGGSAEALACSEGSTWKHKCIQSVSGAGGFSVAENYVCGWCPNLQNEENTDSCPSDTTSSPSNSPSSSPSSSSKGKWYAIFNTDEQTASGIVIGIILGCIIVLIALILILKITGRI